MELITVFSKLDNSMQESLFFSAEGDGRPLLVALHTWSFDKENQVEYLLPYVKKENWNLLLPNFRGPNKGYNPECKKACGSEYAVSDILEATQYILDNKNVDKNNVYLFGGSGGAQAALLAQAKAPELWTKSIAYVPIFDLKMWLDENLEKRSDFADDIINCLGNYKENEEEYRLRSPMNYIEDISRSKHLKIYVGKYDDIVDVSQGIEFFNRINAYSKTSNVYFDFFDGGHYVSYEQIIRYFNGTEKSTMLDLSK